MIRSKPNTYALFTFMCSPALLTESSGTTNGNGLHKSHQEVKVYTVKLTSPVHIRDN